MNISESIDEIIEKHDKTKLTYILGVIPLVVLVVFLFIYENQTIRTEKKYEITVNVNSTTAKLYKKDASKHEKLKKADIISSIELGKKVEFLDSINSKWYKVLYYGDTGLIKTKDCFLEQKLLSEEKITRFSTEKNSLFYSYGVLIIIMITFIIYLDKIDKKRKTTVLIYEENENLKNFNLRGSSARNFLTDGRKLSTKINH